MPLYIFLFFLYNSLQSERVNFGPILRPVYSTVPQDGQALHMASSFGIEPESLVVTSSYVSEFNEIKHVYYNQFHKGLPIVNAVANINYDKHGNILSFGHSLYSQNVARSNSLGQAQIVLNDIINDLDIQFTPVQGVQSFAEYLGLDMESQMIQEPNSMNELDQTFYVYGFPTKSEAVPVLLKYLLNEDGSLSLVWDMVVDLDSNWYHSHVCVKSGKVLSVLDWVSDAAYRVFPFGVNDPDSGSRKLVVNPQHPISSPFGWHAQGTGKNKKVYTDTIGNNVFAQENFEGGDSWKSNYRPDGSKSLLFDFNIDFKKEPSTYINASITNLFYWNNLIHDLFYLYGFDEVAGNFQMDNYNKGGREGDAVIANAQDGSGVNNANFATPPDGQQPRMRMYTWNAYSPMHDGDLESGIIIHEYAHGISIRLTGGPMNVGCLGWGEAGGMGEGWGDFFATILRMKQGDTRNSSYSMGEYSAGSGIRKYNYSTSTSENPSTYSFINKPGYWGVHAKGEVWAEILYEVYWNVVDVYGFTLEWFDHSYKRHPKKKRRDFGNRMMLQNVVDGLKLQPCYPSFVDARDAILLADRQNYKGISQCLMWKAFAKRGLGVEAKTGGLEDFTIPQECE